MIVILYEVKNLVRPHFIRAYGCLYLLLPLLTKEGNLRSLLSPGVREPAPDSIRGPG